MFQGMRNTKRIIKNAIGGLKATIDFEKNRFTLKSGNEIVFISDIKGYIDYIDDIHGFVKLKLNQGNMFKHTFIMKGKL